MPIQLRADGLVPAHRIAALGPVAACRSTIGQRGNLITRPPQFGPRQLGVHNARSDPPLFELVATVSRARLKEREDARAAMDRAQPHRYPMQLRIVDPDR
jgi:hypothetical protein